MAWTTIIGPRKAHISEMVWAWIGGPGWAGEGICPPPLHNHTCNFTIAVVHLLGCVAPLLVTLDPPLPELNHFIIIIKNRFNPLICYIDWIECRVKLMDAMLLLLQSMHWENSLLPLLSSIWRGTMAPLWWLHKGTNGLTLSSEYNRDQLLNLVAYNIVKDLYLQ